MADGDIRMRTPKRPQRDEPSVGVPAGLPADAPLTGADPAVPPVPHEGPAVLGSAEPLAVGAARGSAPVLGAGSAGLGTPRAKVRLGDRVFAAMTTGASAFVVVLVLLVAVFLFVKSMPSILDDKTNFFTSTEWSTAPNHLRFGIAALLYTTVVISLIALLFAVPIAIGIALFITQYAPPRLARPVAYVIDLLAAIPSIIYGIWGYSVLAPHLTGVQRALNHLGAFPLLADRGLSTGTLFDGSVVLAIMVLPIVTAISRDVFERTPTANKEASLALGATRWEMIRMAVLPYGRAGVVSGAMLGLGRALGETIAVFLILSKVSKFSPSIFGGGETFASKIANNASEFSNPRSTGAYIAAGLVLFVLTFIVNAVARAIVNRRRDFA